jgi:hypothetical protein
MNHKEESKVDNDVLAAGMHSKQDSDRCHINLRTGLDRG